MARRRGFHRRRESGLRRRLESLVGVVLLVAGGSLVFRASGASASSLTNGPVALSTIGSVTANTPYSSGQVIEVTVAANSTLALTNLESHGFSGEPPMKVEECSDPGGSVANLPSSPAGNCDALTLEQTAAVNSDGSFTLNNYSVYALPDTITLLEPSDQTPVCGLGNNECVLFVGPDPTNFANPHLFSSPFSVKPNSDDGGENPGDGSQQAQTQTSASRSTVVASPTEGVANGVSDASVTVTLLDTNGLPVAGGKQVTLSQGSGHSVIEVDGKATDTGTTDPTTGVVTFSVTDTTDETVTYTATDVTDSNLTLTPSVPPTVQFAAPVVTAANSTISAVPTTVPSGTTSAITVTLNDQGDAPVTGKAVTLKAENGTSTITVVSGSTNTHGQATFTVSDSSAESVTYTATDTTDGISLTGVSVAVTFGTLTVSSTASTVTAKPVAVSSQENSQGSLPTGTVTVTLLAPDGHSLVSGKTVTLSASSSNAVITPNSAVTGSNGQATFGVSDGTAENVTFSAEDTTDGVAVTQTAVIAFEVPAASPTTSSMIASATTQEADGVTPVGLTVTILDQFGEPVPGVVVNVTANSVSTRVAAIAESTKLTAGTTDSSGKAFFEAYDTTAETVTYTATDTTDNVTIAQTAEVTFTAGPPQVSNCNISAAPTQVAADGKTSSTIMVTLEDHNDNPVPGKTVSLSATGGSSTITAVTATTNAQGQAAFTVVDSTSEVVTYTATDTTDDLVLAGEEASVTFGTPTPIVPAIADSTITSGTTSVPADGTTAATITVVLSDAKGNAISGKTVSLNPEGGNASVTTVSGVTNNDGMATFSVTDKTPETVTFTATDVTDNLPLSGQTVTITFTSTTGGNNNTGQSSASSSGTTTTSTSPGSTQPGAVVPPSAGTSADTSSATSSEIPNVSSSELAFTGSPRYWRWLLALGCILLGIGTIARRRIMAGLRPAHANGDVH